MQHGHVRYIGVSNWAAWQIAKALGISERLGLARFASLQAYYTIAGRDLERELVPMMQSEGVGLMVWSPLAGGLLSGKYGRDGQSEAGSRRLEFDFPPVNKDRAFDCVDVMRVIAESKGVSVAQIALAWLLHQKAVTSVIIGAKRVEQLDGNIAATGIRLSEDELKQLDAVSALPREYPGWMLERQESIAVISSRNSNSPHQVILNLFAHRYRNRRKRLISLSTLLPIQRWAVAESATVFAGCRWVLLKDSYQQGPGSLTTSVPTDSTLPSRSAEYFATTSPNAFRCRATSCPALTVSPGLTKTSANPPVVARIELIALPIYVLLLLAVAPILPSITL